jgi:hypothetical protein
VLVFVASFDRSVGIPLARQVAKNQAPDSKHLPAASPPRILFAGAIRSALNYYRAAFRGLRETRKSWCRSSDFSSPL